MEAVSGQLLLDFDQAELNRLVEFRSREPTQTEHEQRVEAERWFQRGLELEQTGASLEQVTAAYEKAVKLDAKSAGALVKTPRGIIARPSSPIPPMPWHTSTWPICTMNGGSEPKRWNITRPRSKSLPITPTRITIWPCCIKGQIKP